MALNGARQAGKNLIELVVDNKVYNVGVTDEQLETIEKAEASEIIYNNIVRSWNVEVDDEDGHKIADSYLTQITNATNAANTAANYITAGKTNLTKYADSTGLIYHYEADVLKNWEQLRDGEYTDSINKLGNAVESIKEFSNQVSQAVNLLKITIAPGEQNNNELIFSINQPLIEITTDMENEGGFKTECSTKQQEVVNFNLDLARIPSDSFSNASDLIVSYIYTDASTESNHIHTPVYCKHIISNFKKSIPSTYFNKALLSDKESLIKGSFDGETTSVAATDYLYGGRGKNTSTAKTFTPSFNFNISNVEKIVNSRSYIYYQKCDISNYKSGMDNFYQKDCGKITAKRQLDDSGKYNGTTNISVSSRESFTTEKNANSIVICGFEAYLYYTGGNVFYIIVKFDDLNNLEKLRPSKVRFSILRTKKELTQSQLSEISVKNDYKPYISEQELKDDKISPEIIEYESKKDIDVSITGGTSEKRINLDSTDSGGNPYYYYLVMQKFGENTDQENKARNVYNNVVSNGKILNNFSNNFTLKKSMYNLTVDCSGLDIQTNTTTVPSGTKDTQIMNCSSWRPSTTNIKRTADNLKTSESVSMPSTAAYEQDTNDKNIFTLSQNMMNCNTKSEAYKYFSTCPTGFWENNSSAFDGSRTHRLNIKYPTRKLKIVLNLKTKTPSNYKSAALIYPHIMADPSQGSNYGDFGNAIKGKSSDTPTISGDIVTYVWTFNFNFPCYLNGYFNGNTGSGNYDKNYRIFYDFECKPGGDENKVNYFINKNNQYVKSISSNHKRIRLPLVADNNERYQNFSPKAKDSSGNIIEIGPVVSFTKDDENDVATVTYNCSDYLPDGITAVNVSYVKAYYSPNNDGKYVQFEYN